MPPFLQKVTWLSCSIHFQSEWKYPKWWKVAKGVLAKAKYLLCKSKASKHPNLVGEIIEKGLAPWSDQIFNWHSLLLTGATSPGYTIFHIIKSPVASFPLTDSSIRFNQCVGGMSSPTTFSGSTVSYLIHSPYMRPFTSPIISHF